MNYPFGMIAAASSAGGKPALSYNLILKVHRGAVEMMCIYIYICVNGNLFSPSIHVDDTWPAAKTYTSDVMKVEQKKQFMMKNTTQ